MKIRELVEDYYRAVIREDEEKVEELLNSELIFPMVVLLMMRNSRTFIPKLIDTFGESPESIVYEPEPEVAEKIRKEFTLVLIGLSARLLKYKRDLKMKDPALTEDEIIKQTEQNNWWQVERIIRSEMHIIREKAQLDVVEQIFLKRGLVITKTWVSVLDDRTCPTCLAMHGTTIPFSESFVYNGSEIVLSSMYDTFADAHPNCRCQIEFNVEGR